jgi:type III restriction enzyme
LFAETKAENEMTSEEVIIKAQAGSEWCKNASTVSTKPWHYLLIPHNEVVESKRLDDYLRFRFES